MKAGEWMKNKLLDLYNVANENIIIRETCFENINTINYLVLFDYSEKQYKLLVDNQGELSIGEEAKMIKIENSKSYLFLMNLLELPINEIKSQLRSRFYLIWDKINILEVFPFFEIVYFVFQSPSSSYWFELAYSWFDDLSQKDKKKLILLLENYVDNKKGTQKIRHRIIKDIKKLQ